MPTSRFDASKADLLLRSMAAYEPQVINPLKNVLSAIGLSLPSVFEDISVKYNRAVLQLGERFRNTNTNVMQCKVDDDLQPFLKRCLLYFRRKHVADIQKILENTTDLEIIERFDKSMASVDICNEDTWFIETTPMRMPRLADFCTLRFSEQIIKETHRKGSLVPLELPQRQYDDKFGVLQPASALAPSMAYWRQQCEFRDVGLALAYFDIDNFKRDFNSHTETVVDRNCLPVILRSIEAHCFLHAEAFHIGGDEVIVLIPNMDKEGAIEFMDRLRLKLPTLTYISVPSKAKISTGLVHVTPDCPLTDKEIEQKANDAKHYAKSEGGKDCIVTYKGERFTKDQLMIVRPRPVHEAT